MLPEKFRERMKAMLGSEYSEFEKAMSEPPVRAFRINTLYTDKDEFLSRRRFSLTPVSYCDNGFILNGADGIGATPEHHAGEIYVQDPGAMSALSALEIKEGWRVLDLCAAPGGKSSQAAEKIGNSGFLLANEYVPKRAKICVGNFERLGLKSSVVTSLDTAEFKKYFDSFFDLVILDAPCSGEGMFRKSEEALSEWSEDNVRLCAERQAEILENAAPLIKAGGYLLYSTCTFSLEENEMQVDSFLSRHPEYELIECREELNSVTSDGICFEGAFSNKLNLTRRFYPHISHGEGQFAALLKRRGKETKKQTILYKDASREPSREELSAIKAFFSESLIREPDAKIRKCGENLVLISHGVPVMPYSVFSAGVLLGEVRRGVLHPAHQFFSTYGELFKRQLTLDASDVRLSEYLSGAEIPAPEISGKGYVAIRYGSATLGGGKLSDGKIKNHYPKGLRINK